MSARLIIVLGVATLIAGAGAALVQDNSGAPSGQGIDESYSAVSRLIAQDTFDALSAPQQDILITLAGRSSLGHPTTAVCFAPGTPPDVVEAFNRALFGDPNGRYVIGGRWTSTATNGGGLGQGDPTILTYSFVPDGTFVPNGVGEGSGPSNLFAALNAVFSSTQEWQDRYHEMFARWSELTGITYVYEPNDDGASLFGSAGLLGVRGDVRLAGKFIDGGSNILAYNNFPNGGDMVIDTGDAGFYGSPVSSYLNLRNVLAHEHGHGMGIAHVCPANQTKLLEPYFSTAFDGPQHDDIRAGQRMYGDRFEHNDNAASATDLGAVEADTVVVADVGIDDNGDTDYYAFTVPGYSEVSATVAPVGQVYQSGGQTQGCNSGSTIDTTITHNLGLEIRDTNGVTVLASATTNPAGQSETISGLFLSDPSGGTYYVRVIPSGTNDVQLYTLDLTVVDLDCNNNGILDDVDLAGGTSSDCNSNGVPDECDRDCNENGIPDDCDIIAGTLTDANSNGFADECEVLYVDQDAVAGARTGRNWTDAMIDLGAATAFAGNPENGITEVWVATGTYTPDSGSGSRSASIRLTSGVAMYGGFAGTESAREERDPIANPTVLSGDLAGDDGARGGVGMDENSLHVVVAADVDATAVLDGFVVTGGNADGEFPDNSGGGLNISGGAGPVIRNCVFIDNWADNLGGGVNTNNNAGLIEGCTFLANVAGNRGGGLHHGQAGSATIVNCAFSGNSANLGGGMANAGQPVVANCSFGGNTAGSSGGGIYNLSSSSVLNLVNSVLWNNSDAGGVDESAQIHLQSGTVSVNYSCIQGLTGGLGGVGNIGTDPLFADADGADNVVGTEDDDLRPADLSPCADAGDNTAVPAGVLVDLDGNPRFADDPDVADTGNGTAPIVDMGAFERPAPAPPGCVNACGDIDASGGIVDLVDFASFALCFGALPESSPACLCSDLDGDGAINLVDFATFSLTFGGVSTNVAPDCP